MKKITRSFACDLVEVALFKTLGKKVNLEVELRNGEFGEIAEETLDFLEGKTLDQGLTITKKTVINFKKRKDELEKIFEDRPKTSVVKMDDDFEYDEIENEIFYLENVAIAIQEEIDLQQKTMEAEKKKEEWKSYRKSRWATLDENFKRSSRSEEKTLFESMLKSN